MPSGPCVGRAISWTRTFRTCFQEALKLARSQRAKSWELRASVSLGHLWNKQGQRKEARELLQGIYDWFTEGFDTPDLIDAKALLDELS